MLKIPEQIEPTYNICNICTVTDDNLLLRFVHSCYYDVEKAKSAMNSFFNIRLSSPELLDGRDPESPELQKVMSIV